jgi:hypothetical protein
MKTTLAAIALAAALAHPANAVTFPSLTTIYVGTGVKDSGGGNTATGVATTFVCSNVSGNVASLRFVVLDNVSSVVGSMQVTLAHGRTGAISTHNESFYDAVTLNTVQFGFGAVNIESTESGVFCSAVVVDAALTAPNGLDLHLVRVNPHPGTVE